MYLGQNSVTQRLGSIYVNAVIIYNLSIMSSMFYLTKCVKKISV